jgi:hypothetical protein
MSHPNLASLANITTTYKNYLCYKIKAVAVYNWADKVEGKRFNSWE